MNGQVSELDRDLMGLALRAARQGRPSPNPHVGAVIVRDGEVIATGYHAKAGQAHAEVDALRKLAFRAERCTMYVTLEPCSHHGRTGPCWEAIAAAGITRTVIGCEDPVPAHAGGAERLEERGVEVIVGVCREEAEDLIADFSKHNQLGLPYVVLREEAAARDALPLPRGGELPYDAVLLEPTALTTPPPRGVVPVVVDPLLAMGDGFYAKLAGSGALVAHGPRAGDEALRRLLSLGLEPLRVPVVGSTSDPDFDALLRALAKRQLVRVAAELGTRHRELLVHQRLADAAAQLPWPVPYCSSVG